MYSQGKEEAAILEALGGVPTGRFLEIGAYHPTTFSNTRALYELGWSGVMIEPGPAQLKALLAAYGGDERISIISAAIGPVRGLAKLHVTDDATSTTDTEHFHKWSQVCRFYGELWVPTITVSDVLNQFGAFDFVSIDAEGISTQIFYQLLDTAMRPQAFCVEHDGRMVELEAYAGTRGYSKVFQNGENLVFKRK